MPHDFPPPSLAADSFADNPSARFERQRAYWRDHLADWTPAIDLPSLGAQPAESAVAEASFRLPAAIRDGLARWTADQSLGAVLLTAFLVLLYRYSHQRDLSIGVAGEPLDAAYLPLRVILDPREAFGALAGRVASACAAGRAHADGPEGAPAAELAALLSDQPGTSQAIERLLPATWELRDSAAPAEGESADLAIRLFPAGEGSGEWLEGRLRYNPASYDPALIAGLADCYLHLLGAAAAETPIAALPILAPDEQRRLCLEWNATASATTAGCVHHLIERQAARTPHATAVTQQVGDGWESLTYAALERRANQLAHELRGRGVGRGPSGQRRVGVCLPRSIDLIVAVLAVLKAGGAYVPIDPEYPAERKRVMLADSGAALVITCEGLELPAAAGEGTPWQPLVLERAAQRLAQQPDHPPRSGVAPGNIAYMIYTSGSTGRPKGVLIEHRSLANFTEQAIGHYAMAAEDRVLQCSSISWDTSAEEIYPCLASGGTLVLRTPAMLDTARGFIERCRDWRLSVINLASAFWHELMADEARAAINGLADLRLVIIGGERVNPERVAVWQRLIDPRIRLMNTYGATEATAITTTFDLTATQAGPGLAGPAQEVPIGRPFPNVRTYILDALMNPVPRGVLGDLYIGGHGLARGYHLDPALTAEKFVPWGGPGAEPGERLYRTGDVARYRADGAIEYFGRLDHQVKIRGHRIALGEIEATLSGHPALRDVVVLAREDQPGRKRLVAYVVAQGAPADSAGLRAFLADRLPAHMLPAAFVALPALPLTTNGKIDRGALRATLPPPGTDQPAPGSPLAGGASLTPTEQILAAIWRDLLEVGAIGPESNFFELGGHSLLAMHLISQVRERLGAELSQAAMLAHPRLRPMAGLIDGTLAPANAQWAPAAIDFAAEARLDPAITFADATRLSDRASARPAAVLLTGATGFLGAFLLAELLRATDAEIYCLVRAREHSGRPADAAERIQRSLRAYNLAVSDPGRIKPIAGDLDQPLLGLGEAAFDALANAVDAIYHNGAWVNFVYPYAALKAANVAGTQEIIRLAGRGAIKPLHFISTLAVAEAACPPGAEVVDEATDLPALASDSGYVQSKWVAEKLVMQARARGLPASIYRPDRIAGDSRGAGNEADFFFRLVAGCAAMGVAPDLDLRERMLPVDYVSQAIVRLSRRPDAAGRAFHLFNERPVEFGAVIRGLRTATGEPIAALPYERWRELLLQTATPAHPLYPFTGLFPADPAELDGLGYQTAIPVSNRNTVQGLSDSGLAVPAIDAAAIQALIAQIIAQIAPAAHWAAGDANPGGEAHARRSSITTHQSIQGVLP